MNLSYCYDGTFAGLMTCVFHAYEKGETPPSVFSAEDKQGTLFPAVDIDTDAVKAKRVTEGLRKLGTGRRSAGMFGRTGEPISVLRFIQDAFLTCLPDKELHILAFVRLAFERGADVSLSMLTDPRVSVLDKAIGHLLKEVQLLKGFVRFEEVNGVLTSTIEPKNYALPYLAPHFADRFPEENFVIFDKTHGMAALSERGQFKFAYADIEFDAPDAQERTFAQMWKTFYDTIAIPERFNPRCRMSLAPKRYWSHMIELAGER